MAQELKSENGAEFLLLADVHHASQLHEVAKHFIATQHFIATHWRDVKEIDG